MDEAQFHHFLLLAWLALAAVVCCALFIVDAPYGRHARSGWGPQVSARAGWMMMELPALLTFVLFFILGDFNRGAAAIVFLALWSAHYANRSFIDPFRRRGASRLPLVVAASGLAFSVVNGYLNGRYLFTLSGGYPASWPADPRFIVGGFLFGGGLAINLRSDRILRNLRRPGESGYRIPRGGPYRWVSCPNYLGEILEWTGWAVATWSLPGLAFAVWTAANLAPRALAHHAWYRERFPDYPRERRALIPYVW